MAKTRPSKPITPTKPKVVPAEAETTYPYVRLKNMRLMAGNPNQDAVLRGVLAYYRETGDEKVPLEDAEGQIEIVVRDLFTTAEEDADQIAALEALLDGATVEQEMGLVVAAVQHAVERYAKALGKI